jgi:hypothetical protein
MFENTLAHFDVFSNILNYPLYCIHGRENNAKINNKLWPFKIGPSDASREMICYYFSRHYQIAAKIKPLYLIHNTCYMTSNTTKVVRRH